MKKTLLVIPLSLASLLVVFFTITSPKYEKVDFSKWNDEAKAHLKGKTETGLLKNIISFAGSEGEFRGTIKQYRSGNQLVIEMHEDYIPDDSITSLDKRFVAEKKNDGFEVIEYSQKVRYRW